jgi:hypothetical protein
MLFDDQLPVLTFFRRNPDDPNRPIKTADPETRHGIAEAVSRKWMIVWGFRKPIDIANGGSPLNVLMWQGHGASGGTTCGVDIASHPWTSEYVEQRAFIINSDGKGIDEGLTRLIFGAPEESSPARSTRRPSTSPALSVGTNGFRPLAESIGIFGYRGRYYIETENKPKTKDGPLPPVIVYLRQHNHTAKVCAFRPDNVPGPEG